MAAVPQCGGDCFFRNVEAGGYRRPRVASPIGGERVDVHDVLFGKTLTDSLQPGAGIHIE